MSCCFSHVQVSCGQTVFGSRLSETAKGKELNNEPEILNRMNTSIGWYQDLSSVNLHVAS